MKIILILCGLILAGAAAWFFLARKHADHYGNAFRDLGTVELAQLVDKPGEFLKKELRIQGTLTRQCPSSGCWFFLKDAGGKELKVEMGDTTPRLPARLGKTATVEGQLILFGKEYEFVGTAVEFH
jgi:hypothetical protein